MIVIPKEYYRYFKEDAVRTVLPNAPKEVLQYCKTINARWEEHGETPPFTFEMPQNNA